ncbi:uncharacterized protein si:zfos-905g2.1 [Pangasianodon hypophthalmus]|uniref:uncharacterized protein si:zfos-905g2.1 n=1 Tax=Pangasianodon hypophthalmus TaxID=310915 RepID=UPI002307609E|nr:uncharacterized protein si:zfos-905g2.1 [Pangasianodon hypophthalmus]
MEPPVFHPPSGMESASVGETQKNVLLEVLSYCRFLHAAVQRLEQKIDNLQPKYRNPEISEEPMVAVRGGQLSWSLAQRLGPSPQTKPLRNSARGQDAAHVLPHSVGGKRNRRRRRRAQRASEPKQEAARDAEEEDPRDNDMQKSSRAKRRRKQRKRLAAAGSEPEEPLSVKEENRNAEIIIKNKKYTKRRLVSKIA